MIKDEIVCMISSDDCLSESPVNLKFFFVNLKFVIHRTQLLRIASPSNKFEKD